MIGLHQNGSELPARATVLASPDIVGGTSERVRTVSIQRAQARPRASRPAPSPKLGVRDGLIASAPIETSYVNDHGFGIQTVTDSNGFQSAEPGWYLGEARAAKGTGLPSLAPQDASHQIYGVWVNNEGHLVRTVDMEDEKLRGVPRMHGCDLPKGFRRGRIVTSDSAGGPPKAKRSAVTRAEREERAEAARVTDAMIRATVQQVLGRPYTGPIDKRMRQLALDVIAHQQSVRAYTADTRKTGHA